MNAFVALAADDDGWGHMGDWGGGWMLLWGPLMMIGFAVLIVWLVRASGGVAGPAPREPTERAREILAERFAKGELSKEEYRERIGELR
jgi:putative membrane protein